MERIITLPITTLLLNTASNKHISIVINEVNQPYLDFPMRKNIFSHAKIVHLINYMLTIGKKVRYFV
jgi:hypothetical protein